MAYNHFFRPTILFHRKEVKPLFCDDVHMTLIIKITISSNLIGP